MSRDIMTQDARGVGGAEGAAVDRARLLARLDAELSAHAGKAARRVRRVTLSVDRVDPLAWLVAQRPGCRFFWSGRDDDSRTAAAGVADFVTGDGVLETLGSRVEALPAGARYLGGMRFDAASPVDEPWRSFGPARFVLPRFELVVEEEVATLSVNLVFPRDAGIDAAELLAELRDAGSPAEGRLPLPIDREDSPPTDEWCASVEDALGEIRIGALDKVVLARRVRYAFDDRIDPYSLLDRLRAAEAGCFHFLIDIEDGSLFLGASPELLIRWEDGKVRSEAVAGTRPRDGDADQREALLASPKDRREHDLVRAHVTSVLANGCSDLRVGATEAMELTSKWHLRTAVSASPRNGETPLALLRRLHPTPAICGTPTDAAATFIRDAEPFDRGWYAGPIGWIGRDAAEFAVAIRCGVIRHDGEGSTLDLYSGAGIVDGSVPEREADEVEYKLGTFTRALGLER